MNDKNSLAREDRARLESERIHRRRLVHRIDKIVTQMIGVWWRERRVHTLRLREINKLLGYPSRDKPFEQKKLDLLDQVTVDNGMPKQFLRPFFRRSLLFTRRDQDRMYPRGK